MRRGLFIFLLGMWGVLTVRAQDVQNCSQLVGSCDYYQCVERREACGSDSYYTKFGLHYCRKYKKDQSSYSPRGQEFLSNIRSCLQEELERERTRANELPQCSQVKKFAIETHKYCYKQNRFCDLPIADRLKVKFTAKKELGDFQMFLFAVWLEKNCLL